MQALALVNGGGLIHSATAHGRALLRRYFFIDPARARLPQPVCRWLRCYGVAKAAPFIIRDSRAELVITLLRPETDRAFCLLLETRPLSPRASGCPGATRPLTTRQREVLHWIAEGKSNPEIALILGRSTHTVNAHVVQILARLGVTSRTAAAYTAASIL